MRPPCVLVPAPRACSVLADEWAPDFPERPLGLGSAREIGSSATPQPSERPQENEPEDDDPDPHLDHPTARLAPFGNESPRRDHAAGRPEPGAVDSACEQETDCLVLGNPKIAVGPGRTADDDRAVQVALHALVDLDGEQPLRRPLQFAVPFGHDASDDRGVGSVEALAERLFGADARTCLARQQECGKDGTGKRSGFRREGQVTTCN